MVLIIVISFYLSIEFNKIKKFVYKITDKSNDDQLKAVTGICLMLGALIVMGLYSNLL